MGSHAAEPVRTGEPARARSRPAPHEAPANAAVRDAGARFDFDFRNVAVHADGFADEVTGAFGARALTVNDHVFLSAQALRLPPEQQRSVLAHELTHVVQQSRGSGAGNARAAEDEARAISSLPLEAPVRVSHGVPRGLLQYDLIDDVRAAWDAPPAHTKGRVFDVLRRLAPVAGGRSDAQVEQWIDQCFPVATFADDNWLAHELLRNGGEANWQLGDATARTGLLGRAARAASWAPETGPVEAVLGETGAHHLPIQAFYFQGQTDRRALVIGGVHGSEESGIETARLLVHDLGANTVPANRPYFTVIVVPELFPEQHAISVAQHNPAGTGSNTGRYVAAGKDPNRNLPAPGTPLATAASATRDNASRSGDPIAPENHILLQLIDRFRPERIASVHANRSHVGDRGAAKPLAYGAGGAGIFVDPAHPGTIRPGTPLPPEDQLAADMAQRAQTGGARVPENFVGDPRGPETRYPSGALASQPGTSLGGWAPSVGITTVTVEVLWYEPSAAFPATVPAGANPWMVTQTDRLRELQGHADALREIFLGPGNAAGSTPLPP